MDDVDRYALSNGYDKIIMSVSPDCKECKVIKHSKGMALIMRTVFCKFHAPEQEKKELQRRQEYEEQRKKDCKYAAKHGEELECDLCHKIIAYGNGDFNCTTIVCSFCKECLN